MKKYRKYQYIIGLLLIYSCSQAPNINQPTAQNIEKEENKSSSLAQINPEALQHIMDGQFYLDQGDFAMAIVELQDAQRLEPNVSSIYVALAECYWNLNKPSRSLEYLEIAIEIEPTNIDAHEIIGEQFFRLRNFSKAEEHYKILHKLKPENEEYLFALGDLAKLQNDNDSAIYYYQKIFESNNNSVQALESSVDLMHRLGKYDEAALLYQELLKIDSLNLNYLSAYTDVMVQLNNPEEAIKSAQKVIEIDGASPENLIPLGILYSEFDMNDKAIATFQEILSQDSTDAAGLHFLSTIYRENEDFEYASQYAEKLQVLHPKNPQGYINAALVALDQDDSEKAITILSNISAEFPDDYSVQYLLGMSYYQSENYKMAVIFLDNALQIAPGSRNTLHILALVNENLDNWAISDGLYQQLIDTDSTDAQAYNNYAYSLIEREEKVELSKEYSRRAIELAPEQAAYLDTYGWILFKMGNREDALKYIDESLEINNENSEVLEHKGDVLSTMQKLIEAKEYYQKALEFDPENKILIDKINDL